MGLLIIYVLNPFVWLLVVASCWPHMTPREHWVSVLVGWFGIYYGMIKRTPRANEIVPLYNADPPVFVTLPNGKVVDTRDVAVQESYKKALVRFFQVLARAVIPLFGLFFAFQLSQNYSWEGELSPFQISVPLLGFLSLVNCLNEYIGLRRNPIPREYFIYHFRRR